MEGVIKGTHEDYPGELINMHCLGFDFNEPGQFSLEEQLKMDGEIFVTLRDAKGIIPSYYHFAKNFEPFYHYEVFEELSQDMASFVTCRFGVPRVCNFLNGVEELSRHRKVNIFFFEDKFDVQSVHEIPKLLGIDYQISEQQAQQIFEDTKMSTIKAEKNKEVAPSDIGSMYRRGSPKSELLQPQQDEIDNYLREHCELEVYRERYL
jgi:hypothetical protein